LSGGLANRVGLILRPFGRADEEILVRQEATVKLLIDQRPAVDQPRVAQPGAEAGFGADGEKPYPSPGDSSLLFCFGSRHPCAFSAVFAHG
jgi:hypothetical protein